jgi:hypothetical protein
MSTNLQHLRSRLTEFAKAGEALTNKRTTLEQSIATATQRLADLEKGIGAPDRVSDWLRLKAELATSIEVDRQELESLAEMHEQVTRGAQGITGQLGHAELAELVNIAIRDEYPQFDAAMSKAHAALSRIFGLYHHLNQMAVKHPLGSREQLRILKIVESLPKPIDIIEVTRAQTEAAAQFWDTVSQEISKLSEPTPSLDQAAE